jgi:hypothetical protein
VGRSDEEPGRAVHPSIRHYLVLHRIDPEQGIRRFYSLIIEKDLLRDYPPGAPLGPDWHAGPSAGRDLHQ